MRDERGQAALFAVFLVAIAAVALAGLRAAQTELLARAVDHRAGEAAVEAAAAVVADAYAGEMSRRLLPRATARAMRDVVADGRVVEAARSAASDISTRNDGPLVSSVEVVCDDSTVTVTLALGRITYRAGFAAGECSPR